MHSVGRNPSLIRIIASAIFASVGNFDVASRRTYNPSRTVQPSSAVGMFGRTNNPPRRGQSKTTAPRSAVLSNQLIAKAAEKRERKNIKRHYDYQSATRFYVNHENYHMPLKPFVRAE